MLRCLFCKSELVPWVCALGVLPYCPVCVTWYDKVADVGWFNYEANVYEPVTEIPS